MVCHLLAQLVRSVVALSIAMLLSVCLGPSQSRASAQAERALPGCLDGAAVRLLPAVARAASEPLLPPPSAPADAQPDSEPEGEDPEDAEDEAGDDASDGNLPPLLRARSAPIPRRPRAHALCAPAAAASPLRGRLADGPDSPPPRS